MKNYAYTVGIVKRVELNSCCSVVESFWTVRCCGTTCKWKRTLSRKDCICHHVGKYTFFVFLWRCSSCYFLEKLRVTSKSDLGGRN